MILVYITCADKSAAARISQVLLSEKLIACANVLGNIESHYLESGESKSDTECLLLAKTHERLWPKLVKRAEELHSYKTPCIVAYPAMGVNESYETWLKKELGL
jgi:periplasmic divalent cation tolerance protein